MLPGGRGTIVRGEVDCCLTSPRRYFSSSCRFASEMVGKVTSVLIAEECSCKVYRLASNTAETRLLFNGTAGAPPARVRQSQVRELASTYVGAGGAPAVPEERLRSC